MEKKLIWKMHVCDGICIRHKYQLNALGSVQCNYNYIEHMSQFCIPITRTEEKKLKSIFVPVNFDAASVRIQ